jgi:Cysteine-rich CPCC
VAPPSRGRCGSRQSERYDDTTRYPCPCCGYLVLDEEPGSYEICPICFWEDDVSQLRWPDSVGGANRPSLIEAQAAFAEIGAIEPRLVPYVRKPRDDDGRDPKWCPFDASRDEVEQRVPGVDYGMTYANDPTAYYYWVKSG